MAKKFAEHNGLNLTQTNNDVLAAWEKNDIFHKSIDEREGCPQFILYFYNVFTFGRKVTKKICFTQK